MASIFAARNVWKSHGRRDVVCGLDIEVRRGEIVGLLGPSGSGKSTLFRILAGAQRADAGTVSIDGRDVSHLGVDARARLQIGYLPQAPELFSSLSVRDNLRIAIDARSIPWARAQHVLKTVLRWFEIDHLEHVRLSALSGGQRRLVQIAFAVGCLPAFLLLDEPFAGLDPIVVERVAGYIRALARSGVGILMTDHKARFMLSLISRAYVISNGTLIASGLPDAVAADQRVRAALLGDD